MRFRLELISNPYLMSLQCNENRIFNYLDFTIYWQQLKLIENQLKGNITAVLADREKSLDSSLVLFELFHWHFEKFYFSIFYLICKSVLEGVNVSDGLQDDVQLGHIVLGRYTGHQLFQPEISMAYKNENEMLRC